jgi:hypothetical protein
MLGTEMIEAEPENLRKVETIHKNWKVMFAGHVPPAFPVMDAARESLAKHKKPPSVQDVMQAVWMAYKAERLKVVEAVHLSPIGWTLDEFKSPAAEIIPAWKRVELLKKMEDEKLGVSLLVAGFDGQGKGHIFNIRRHYEPPERNQSPGFQSIGSGSDAADWMLMYRSASWFMPLRLMLYYAYEAKRFGEEASGVGAKTDLLVMRGDGSSFRVKETALENKLAKLFEELKPKGLEARHLNILNGITGEYIDRVPKLHANRENGRLMITGRTGGIK